jgi:hypothetical protein
MQRCRVTAGKAAKKRAGFSRQTRENFTIFSLKSAVLLGFSNEEALAPVLLNKSPKSG